MILAEANLHGCYKEWTSVGFKITILMEFDQAQKCLVQSQSRMRQEMRGMD